MIARLTGTVHPLDTDRVLVDVAGVGYEVFVPASSFVALPGEGAAATLEIHTHVREDAFTLFGFTTREEKAMFLKLLTVSGIGPKVALSVLSGVGTRELAGTIARGDVKRLTQIPHVGKKIAERIVLELKDKVGNVVELDAARGTGKLAALPLATKLAGPQEEALSALMNLGYKRAEAEAALADVPVGVTEVTDIVRAALKALATRLAR